MLWGRREKYRGKQTHREKYRQTGETDRETKNLGGEMKRREIRKDFLWSDSK